MMPDKSVTAVTDGLNQCFRINKNDGYKEAYETDAAAEQVQANLSSSESSYR